MTKRFGWNPRLSEDVFLGVLGGVLISTGVACRIAFKAYFPEAGRIEMGWIALFQAIVYSVGISLALIALGHPRHSEYRQLGCVVCVLVSALLVYLILGSLPP
jgi:hypothetical protein